MCIASTQSNDRVGERESLRVADEQRRRRTVRPGRVQHPVREIHAAHFAAMRAPGELGRCSPLPQPDVEDTLVTARGGEIERPRRRADQGLLEPVDRLARREVRVGGVLHAGEVLPVDEAITHSGTHSSQTTLP